MSNPGANPTHTHCQNCGTALQGRFCHRCGQHDIEFHGSFGHVLLEALENFVHFDEKFFRTVFTLLFQPGRLSLDFNAGRRASQMPPFRLYLFISVLFFFTRFLGSRPGDSGGDLWVPDDGETRTGLTTAVRDLARATPDPEARRRMLATLEKLRDPALQAQELTDAQLRDLPAGLGRQIRRELAAEDARRHASAGTGHASELNVTVGEKADSALNRFLSEKGRLAVEHPREIRDAFMHALPKLLLVCLPLFALYSRMLFRRTGQVYLQHLIISLHYHTFVFLWWPASAGWHELFGLWSPFLAGVVGLAAGFWMFLYPFVMLRRIFGQPWLRTALKTLVLGGAYGATLVLGILVTGLLVVLTA